MSTVNTALYSGQYYQLPTNGSAATDLSAVATPSPSPIDAAASAAASTDAFLLDLSPDAQNFLSGVGSSAAPSAFPSPAPSTDSNFALSAAQQQKLASILADYKNLPLTQDNYIKMQNDLKAAGLSPDQLSAQDEINSVNPTQTLLDALAGQQDPLVSSSDFLSGEQTKANNYMSGIVQAWQTSSSTGTSGISA